MLCVFVDFTPDVIIKVTLVVLKRYMCTYRYHFVFNKINHMLVKKSFGIFSGQVNTFHPLPCKLK